MSAVPSPVAPAAAGSRAEPALLRRGALAGAAGAVVLGATTLAAGGVLPRIAAVVGAESEAAGLALQAVAAVLAGVLFALATRARRSGAGELMFWGFGYGTLWWLVGTLTLLPLLRGEMPAWSATAVQAALPALLGHLAYGGTLGVALAALGGGMTTGRVGGGALARGGVAGGVAALATLAALGASGRLEVSGLDGPAGSRWAIGVALGALAGAAYGALYPRPRGATGPGLVRGLCFGLLLWLAIPMTLVPALTGDGLPWSLAEARLRAASLPALLLGGALLVALYRMVSALAGTTRADDPGALADEGVGARLLRGLGRGSVAGLVGGILFTGVFVAVDDLDRVARLTGSGSELTGLAVHFAISVVIGASYGVLFRHEGGDPEAALGWGVSYGLLWWLLGGQTLFPVLLGASPDWSASELAAGTPSLVGHLAYGAGLGLVLAALERRSNPWWSVTTQARTRREERRRALLATAAPGLWVVVAVIVLVALTLGAPAPGP